MPAHKNQTHRDTKVYYDTLTIPVDMVEVYHQLEYIREERSLLPQDVHACAVNMVCVPISAAYRRLG